jgi:hypothetical protein
MRHTHKKSYLLINQNHIKKARLTWIEERRNHPQTKNPNIDTNVFFTKQYICNIIELDINLPLFVMNHFGAEEI